MLQVKRSNIVRMWAAAGECKAFGLQLTSSVSATMDSVQGDLIQGVVVPGAADNAAAAAVAIQIPDLDGREFSILPWFALRYRYR